MTDEERDEREAQATDEHRAYRPELPAPPDAVIDTNLARTCALLGIDPGTL